MKEKKEKKSKVIRKLDYLFFVILAVIFGAFGFIKLFQKLEYRFYDILLTLRKSPAQSEQILHVNVDNESIDALGEWPWSRDIFADILIQMKELGAERAVFDIEYLSPSKKGVPSDAITNINLAFEQQSNDIIDSIYLLGDKISSGEIPDTEIQSFTNDLVSDVVNPTINDLYDSVMKNAYRDNDEYFARAIQFFGNAWLTVNTRAVIFSNTEDELKYIDDRLLFKNVNDPKNFIVRDNDYTTIDQYSGYDAGFSPAMHTFIKRANGVGFTNVIVDSDGIRRRVELLFNHNGNYLGQLTFGPLLNYLDVQNIERKRNKLILNGVKFPDSDKREVVKIPLDDNGRMLINWVHQIFGDSFKQESAYSLMQLNLLEDDIHQNLSNIVSLALLNDDGSSLDYLASADELLKFSNDIKNQKEYLLSLCTGYDAENKAYDGISDEQYEEYFSMKKDFYDYVREYTSINFMDEIEERLSQLQNILDEDTINHFRDSLTNEFSILKNNIDAYLQYKKELSEKIKDSICIVGNTASSTTDIGATPFEEKYFNVGTHANVINTVLQKNFITPVSWYIGFLIALLSVFVTMCIVHELSNTAQNISMGAVLVVLTVLPVLLMVVFDIYIPFVNTVLFAISNFIAGLALRFILSSKEKRFIAQIAASFANKDTVDSLRKNPDAFKTSGEKKSITALFSDIQKFSTFSESMSLIYGEEGPNKLIENLNQYLGAMSDEILKNNGTIDKYEGDAIISMFGAPDPMKTHNPDEWAYLCLDSAIKMKKVEEEFNANHKELFRKYTVEAKDENGLSVEKEVELKPFQTRIGINSGEAFVGLMGSKTDTFSKLNYTMIGDTVNLASRLEGVNKAYSTWIMCSDATWNSANQGENKDKIVSKRLDKVRVVGRSTPVQLYNIVGFRDEMSDIELASIDEFHKALDLYLEMKFEEAGKLFLRVNQMNPKDQSALVFAERCKTYIQKGVPAGWDGVMNMTSK